MADGIRKLFGEIFFKDKTSPALGKLNKGMDESKESALELNGLLAGMGGALALAGIARSAGEMIKVAAAFEQTSISFEVMLGSADKAQKLLTDLEDLSLATPFTPEALNESAKMMLNFGIAADSILPSIQMLGDVSGGNAEKFKGLTLAFSQVSSQGRLMGQDLLQMINAGFNPLQVISEKTGKSMKQLKDEMSKGMISFEQVNEAFKIATSEGGKFNNMMEKQSKTWNGLISTMEGFKGQIFKEIGKILIDFLKPALIWLADLTKEFVAFLKTERGIAVLKTVIIALSVAIGIGLVLAFKALAAAIWAALVPMLPFIAIALLIIGVITGIILVIEDLYVFLKGGESVIGDFFGSLAEGWNFVKKTFFKFVNFMKIQFMKFVQFAKIWGKRLIMFLFPFSLIYFFWDEIVDFLKSIPSKIVSFFQQLGAAIVNFLRGILPDWAIALLNKVAAAPAAPAAKAIEGRQFGGPVQAGTPFVVGEAGPEIFVPGRDGNIVPNNAAGGSKVNVSQLVGTINITVQDSGEAAEEVEATILDALNNLANNVLSAELGFELT